MISKYLLDIYLISGYLSPCLPNASLARLQPHAPRFADRGPRFSTFKPSSFQMLQRCNVRPIYPLYFQILAHSSPQRASHNSFHVNHFRTLFSSTEGVPPTLWNRVSPSPIPFLFILLRNRLHFSALVKNSTLLFSAGSALFAKNTAVWGGVSC